MKIRATDIFLSLLALLAVLIVNNDVSIVRSRGAIDSYAYPSAYPYILSILRSYPSPSDATSVKFDVTFSEPVAGVDASDFSLTTTDLAGSSVLAPYSLSSSVYTVEVNAGSGVSGTIRLDLDDDDSILNFGAIPLGGFGDGNGSYANGQTYVIDRSASPSNDTFSSAKTVPSSSFSDEIYTYGAAFDASEPIVDDCGIGQGLATVWYEYTASTNTAISIDTFGADYDTFIAVWTKPVDDLVLISCNDDANGTKQSALALKVQMNVTYYIEIGQPAP